VPTLKSGAARTFQGQRSETQKTLISVVFAAAQPRQIASMNKTNTDPPKPGERVEVRDPASQAHGARGEYVGPARLFPETHSYVIVAGKTHSVATRFLVREGA
jgi:hypothetical protein